MSSSSEGADASCKAYVQYCKTEVSWPYMQISSLTRPRTLLLKLLRVRKNWRKGVSSWVCLRFWWMQQLLSWLKKDCEGRQMDIKDEVKSYLALHDSLHQTVNQKQHTKASATAPAKAGPTGKILNPKPWRASQSWGTPGPAKQTRFAVPKAILEKHVSFSSSACIAYLLQTTPGQDTSFGCDATSFGLRISLQHLKAVANEFFIEKENPNNLSGTFTGPFQREETDSISSFGVHFIFQVSLCEGWFLNS